jgi:hypothetical protein
MKTAPLYTTWRVFSPSPAQIAVLHQFLADRIRLDRVLVDTVQSYPGGVEQAQTVPHRLGDYFEALSLLAGPEQEAGEFRLVFHRRPDAGRFWKDLMVAILEEAQAASQTKAIALDSKGDEAPRLPATASS